MIGFSFIIFSLLYIPPPPPSYLLFSFYYMHTYAQVYIIWMISWKWLINAIITTGCSMIYMRRQVSLAFEISKSWRARQVCLCVSEREREREFEIQIDSRWFVTAYTSFIRSSYLLPALILFEPFIFLVVAVIGVVLFERTLDLVISFYNLVFMMNSFVNSSLSSVSAHFHTPTELNTPKSIQFQNEKKKFQFTKTTWYFPRDYQISFAGYISV